MGNKVMDNKDAKGVLEGLRDWDSAGCVTEYVNAINLGIKALEINQKRLELIIKYNDLCDSYMEFNDFELAGTCDKQVQALEECEISD